MLKKAKGYCLSSRLSLLSLLLTAHLLHPGLWLDSVFADSQAVEVFQSVCAGVLGKCVYSTLPFGSHDGVIGGRGGGVIMIESITPLCAP
ncbi:hypothetical protein SRHO_G00084310 [Serrasalmus rhombeus]